MNKENTVSYFTEQMVENILYILLSSFTKINYELIGISDFLETLPEGKKTTLPVSNRPNSVLIIIPS